MSVTAQPSVWLVRLPDELPANALNACMTLLDSTEQERAARFKVAAAQGQYIAAHALTRLALSAASPGAAPAAWTFDRAAAGKPFVRGGPAFSLSHTAGLVGCAVSGTGEIGFDVEAWDRPVDLATMSAVLTDDEMSRLSSLEAESRRRPFFELWTAKEACAKACGLGIAVGLRDIFFHVHSGKTVANGSVGHWQIVQQLVGARHLFALATADAVAPFVQELSMDALVEAVSRSQLMP